MSLVLDNFRVRVGEFQLSLKHLEVPTGSICCVVGKSGSGKSTLLQAVAGFLPLESGTVFCGEKRLDTLPPERRRVAILFQDAVLFPHWNVF